MVLISAFYSSVIQQKSWLVWPKGEQHDTITPFPAYKPGNPDGISDVYTPRFSQRLTIDDTIHNSRHPCAGLAQHSQHVSPGMSAKTVISVCGFLEVRTIYQPSAYITRMCGVGGGADVE